MTNKRPHVHKRQDQITVYKCKISDIHPVTVAEWNVKFAAKSGPTMKRTPAQNVPKWSCAMSCEIKNLAERLPKIMQ